MIVVKATRKINILDLLLIVTAACCITGYLLARAQMSSLNKVIEGKEKIAIELLIPDVFFCDESINFFKVGEKSAITIRNRPYTKLTIIRFEFKPKMVIIPALNGSYKTVNDPTRTNVKDYIITLSDVALKSNDGYVIGGNKIKIGNQIELEGFNYRLNGKVINIYPLKGENE